MNVNHIDEVAEVETAEAAVETEVVEAPVFDLDLSEIQPIAARKQGCIMT